MATLPESVDYTDKDFDAFRVHLIALIKSSACAFKFGLFAGNRSAFTPLSRRRHLNGDV